MFEFPTKLKKDFLLFSKNVNPIGSLGVSGVDMIKQFSKILIANRGEIALRIIRTAKELGIKTVSLYTLGEENNLHVKLADESESLGSGDLVNTYLNISKIIDIAIKTGADAIHPGYGFLSENADFAEACLNNNLIFIGPSPEVLRQMGNKITAKSIACSAGVSTLSSIKTDSEMLGVNAQQLKYPLLIKASYGGGGKGMQVVRKAEELQEKLTMASRSAKNYFGNGEVFLEEYIENARHIEVQILGDKFGNIVHLFERDCTIQRNHQKIIEEAPATCITNQLRNEIHQAALAIGRKVAYENAGTVEFLVDQQNQFYFLEMNPRIQVEHPVTEQITGIDIVMEQIRIAEGNPVSFQQDEVKMKGHAIELRVYQEDPANNFSPSTKPIHFFQLPTSNEYRIETDLHMQNSTVQFDPLLLKLIATGKNRVEAIDSLLNGLHSTYILGPTTNLNYLSAILQHPSFIENNISTNFLTIQQSELLNDIRNQKELLDIKFVIAAALVNNDLIASIPQNNIWNEIGFWRMNQWVDVVVDQREYRMNWTQKRNQFQLKSNEFDCNGVVLEYSENSLKINIDGEIQELMKKSFPNSKTSIGVEGFICEVFCHDCLNHYPDVDTSNQGIELTNANQIKSHLHGKVIAVNIYKNKTVNKGDVLMVIESMKSENAIVALKKAKIKNIAVSVGDQVTDGMTLVFLEE